MTGWARSTIALAGVLVACAPLVGAPEKAPPAPEIVVPHAPGPMRPVHATKMGEAIAAIGLDPKDLPPLETIDAKRRLRLMRTFSDALGVPCVGCHARDDFAADTRRKRVAKRMWNEVVRVLALEGGEPVYCDSCHQGSMFVLDRRDKAKVSDFMSDVFVGTLKRQDGRDHGCETCHGDPPEFAFLTSWKSAPAPDLDPPAIAPATNVAAASIPAASSAEAAAQPPVAPPRPSSSSRRAPRECGEKKNPCPLQAWMRKNVAPAVAAKDAAAPAVALERVATFSPDASWSWAEMSRQAAAAARRGDLAEARKSCQGCHHTYKAEWNAKYRTRPVR
jgi:hypothetical protein